MPFAACVDIMMKAKVGMKNDKFCDFFAIRYVRGGAFLFSLRLHVVYVIVQLLSVLSSPFGCARKITFKLLVGYKLFCMYGAHQLITWTLKKIPQCFQPFFSPLFFRISTLICNHMNICLFFLAPFCVSKS